MQNPDQIFIGSGPGQYHPGSVALLLAMRKNDGGRIAKEYKLNISPSKEQSKSNFKVFLFVNFVLN